MTAEYGCDWIRSAGWVWQVTGIVKQDWCRSGQSWNGSSWLITSVSQIFQSKAANSELFKNVLVYLFAMTFLCLGSSRLTRQKVFFFFWCGGREVHQLLQGYSMCSVQEILDLKMPLLGLVKPTQINFQQVSHLMSNWLKKSMQRRMYLDAKSLWTVAFLKWWPCVMEPSFGAWSRRTSWYRSTV